MGDQDESRVHRRGCARRLAYPVGAAVMRRLGWALVAVLFVLGLIGDLQRREDLELQRLERMH